MYNLFFLMQSNGQFFINQSFRAVTAYPSSKTEAQPGRFIQKLIPEYQHFITQAFGQHNAFIKHKQEIHSTKKT